MIFWISTSRTKNTRNKLTVHTELNSCLKSWVKYLDVRSFWSTFCSSNKWVTQIMCYCQSDSTVSGEAALLEKKQNHFNQPDKGIWRRWSEVGTRTELEFECYHLETCGKCKCEATAKPVRAKDTAKNYPEKFTVSALSKRQWSTRSILERSMTKLSRTFLIAGPFSL